MVEAINRFQEKEKETTNTSAWPHLVDLINTMTTIIVIVVVNVIIISSSITYSNLYVNYFNLICIMLSFIMIMYTIISNYIIE